jgi:hypothetical protein
MLGRHGRRDHVALWDGLLAVGRYSHTLACSLGRLDRHAILATGYVDVCREDSRRLYGLRNLWHLFTICSSRAVRLHGRLMWSVPYLSQVLLAAFSLLL